MAKSPEEVAADILERRAQELMSEREEIRENLLELVVQEEQIAKKIDGLIAGASALGFELELAEFPRPEREKQLLGTYVNYRNSFRSSLKAFLDAQRQRLTASANDEIAPAQMPKISDIILERLFAAGDAGAKAADIRKFIAKTYTSDIHEKTVGMTLYRLQVQRKVRRDGHTWFLIPQNAESKNPGVAAPGPINSLADQKGGA